MKPKIRITIGRQFGSGGYDIGYKLSEILNIAFYDKELLVLAAKESGLNKSFFEEADERSTHGLSYAFSVGLPYMGMFTPYTDILSNDGLFKLQSDTIRSLAGKQACVIMGRCADYILRDDPNCISMFIHSPQEIRLPRIMEKYKLSKEQAMELMIKKDKERAAYYNYYTNKKWGDAASYDLSIDASILGVEGTVLYIKHLLDMKYPEKLYPR
ncbi:MAG: cytidylate kinase-like family protein [Massilibacteroides sp.]|nr:cytidylate kinase-like family protein [Massilibacteroides sp.]MDD3061315.1 cytidylate kinase-like family protein [Massilibacteroides sp.]MDD4115829.1 cytidylate kinase-like family protein [Massilibacteroides sp.]MDD4659812.1 cytidylate kinase-like family protein [Massilibacteroides sp.]